MSASPISESLPRRRGRGPGVAATCRVVATVWGVVMATALTVGGLVDLIPHRHGAGTLDPNLALPLQLGLLGLYVLGLVVVLRFEAVGAAIVAVTAVSIGLMAALEYPAKASTVLAAALFLPAFLHWLLWRRQRPVPRVTALFAVTALLIGVVYVGADRVYGAYFGPATPQSAEPALAASPVLWAWAGATTATATDVVAKLAEDAGRVRILLGERADLADARPSAAQAAAGREGRVVRARFEGLRPDTVHHYAVEIDGVVDTARQGTVRTFPSGAGDFSVAFASCARTGSNAAVFDTIRALAPTLFINDGDFHYADITADDPAQFRDALDASLTAPSQSRLYRSTSIGYVWDDHDFAGNDANETARSRPAAELVYRQYVPHWPIPGSDTAGPIYQAFTIGRVRFLLTDNRSTRTPQSAPDDADKHMLDADQMAWLRDELGRARDRDGVVVWVNADPWIEAPERGGDGWGGYTTQRREIADLVAANLLERRLMMIAGDAHMLAFDDGTHSDYATAAPGGFPVIQAAALDRPGGAKGGPYTDGPFPGGGQFGLARFSDQGGDTVAVTVTGRTWDDRTLLRHDVTLSARPG